MALRGRAVIVAEGAEVTHRQLEALAALRDRGSMKRAAASLGISTPVLHKYVRETEAKLGQGLVTTSSRGTSLTGAGRDLLRTFEAFELRLRDEDALRVAGTLVSERCVLTAATALSACGTACRVWISTDEQNLRMMDEGRLDCVVLDDALYAMERADTFEGTEVGSDVLMHRRCGPDYARLAFGAQRLAFRHLEQRGVEHRVACTVFEPAVLDTMEVSYFVNRSLVRRGVVKAHGAREQRWSQHSIVAVPCSGSTEVGRFISEARRAGL
ncbi:MAG: LysR family transcriptional regulator [Candidatus Thermoplasmatota archaeon]